MSNFVFAINATLPIFIMIALGYFFRKINIINDNFATVANKFNFSVNLAVLLFVDISNANFREMFDLKFLLYCMIATTVGFFGIWGACKFIFKGKNFVGELVQAGYRSSVAVMGVALIQNIYGSASVGGLMLLGTVPLYNIYAVLVLQFESPLLEKGKGRIKKALIGIAKNPLIIGIVLGLIVSLTGIQFPKLINTSLNYLGRMATPLALICIGAGFNFKAAKDSIKPAIIATVLKVLMVPIIFTGIAAAMGFRNEQLLAILIFLASPTTPAAYVMAKQYGFDGAVTSSTVVFTTLASIFTVTGFVYLLRAVGMI